MPIIFNYTYKNYPHSPKATRYSKTLGLLTCNTAYALLTFLLSSIVMTPLSSTLNEEATAIAVIPFFIVSFLFRKKIRGHFEKKIEAIALKDAGYTSVSDTFAEFDKKSSETKAKNTYTKPAGAKPTSTASSTGRNNDVIFDDNQMYIDF